jgi:hypothetical protein
MDVVATIFGPGTGGFLMGGPDAASAEEGLTATLGEETNTQTIGADGSVMNSLHASRAGTCTVRLMKTSPVNQLLMALYNYQRLSSLLWGRNTITVRDVARGDLYTMVGCAFVRFPTNAYAKVGNVLEYEFHVSLMDPFLGPGAPDGH